MSAAREFVTAPTGGPWTASTREDVTRLLGWRYSALHVPFLLRQLERGHEIEASGGVWVALALPQDFGDCSACGGARWILLESGPARGADPRCLPVLQRTWRPASLASIRRVGRPLTPSNEGGPMQLDTLTIDRDVAREKLASYKAELARRQDDELAAVARALDFASGGVPVIQLSQAIRAGGWFPNGLPRIAVAGSDRRRVTCARFDTWLRLDWSTRRERTVRSVRLDNLPPVNTHVYGVETIVPLVPPDVLARLRRRIRSRNSLGRFLTLFEVEEWAPAVPADPALLDHIGGDLYAVLATWDLSDLERAVLSEMR